MTSSRGQTVLTTPKLIVVTVAAALQVGPAGRRHAVWAAAEGEGGAVTAPAVRSLCRGLLVRTAPARRLTTPAAFTLRTQSRADLVLTTPVWRAGTVTALTSTLSLCPQHELLTSKKGAVAGVMLSGQQPNSVEAQHP